VVLVVMVMRLALVGLGEFSAVGGHFGQNE